MLENARKTYLDAGEGRGRVRFLIALVQLCPQKQINKRRDVFLEICLLLASIGKIHSKEQPHRPWRFGKTCAIMIFIAKWLILSFSHELQRTKVFKPLLADLLALAPSL